MAFRRERGDFLGLPGRCRASCCHSDEGASVFLPGRQVLRQLRRARGHGVRSDVWRRSGRRACRLASDFPGAETVLNWRRYSALTSVANGCDSAEVTLFSDREERQSVYLWGAQLEAGNRVGGLEPGADEVLPVASRAYMEQGLAQALDAGRSATLSLLERAGDDPEHDEVRRVLESLRTELSSVAGTCRYEATNPTAPDGETVVRFFGLAADAEPVLVVGTDGVRCVTDNDSGVPCSPGDGSL